MMLRSLLPFILIFAFGALPAAAQVPSTLFVKSRLSLTQYTGDNSGPVLSTACMDGALGCDEAAYGAGLEVGLQFTPTIGASVTYQAASYPHIAAHPATSPLYAQNYRVRRTVQVLTQYRFPDLFTRLTPYLQTGLHVTTGRTPLPGMLPHASGRLRTAERWAFGPSFSAGVDLDVNRHLALFAEATTSFAFPDDALDGTGGFFGTDRLSWAGFGLKVHHLQPPTRWFGAASSRADIVAASAPSTLIVDEVGLFAVESDAAPDAPPHAFQWTFDDDTVHDGRVVTKRFSRPGTYRVTLHRADGGRREPVHTFQVQVRTAPTRITAVTAAPDSLRPNAPVTFRAETSGPPPRAYRWNLGDGTVAFTAAPTHTYAAPGTYTVELEVHSATDTTTHTRTITVPGPTTRAAHVVQLGAFSDRARAERFVRRHTDRLATTPAIDYDAASGYYRVQLGFAAEAEARRAVRRLRRTSAFAGAFLRTPSLEESAPYSVAAQ